MNEPNYKDLYRELHYEHKSLQWQYESLDFEYRHLKQMLKLRNNQLYRARKQLKELVCNSHSNSTT